MSAEAIAIALYRADKIEDFRASRDLSTDDYILKINDDLWVAIGIEEDEGGAYLNCARYYSDPEGDGWGEDIDADGFEITGVDQAAATLIDYLRL